MSPNIEPNVEASQGFDLIEDGNDDYDSEN